MESIQEKRSKAINLAVKIGYHTDIELNEDDSNRVWMLIDFGYSEDMILAGKCSLQASLDFDMNEWEKQIDKDIESLTTILKED